MKLKDFIQQFSHNNEIWVQNDHSFFMAYRYDDSQEYEADMIMDWELLFTDVAECEVNKILNVCGLPKQGIVIVLDTGRAFFDFIPELVTMDNSPVWLYERVHNVKLQVGESC